MSKTQYLPARRIRLQACTDGLRCARIDFKKADTKYIPFWINSIKEWKKLLRQAIDDNLEALQQVKEERKALAWHTDQLQNPQITQAKVITKGG